MNIPPQGGCEECIGNQCYSTSCNFNCKQTGNSCYTEVLGGACKEFDRAELEQQTNYDHCKFTRAFILLSANSLMEKAGLSEGELVTHINGKYPKDHYDFGTMINSTPKGTVVTVYREGKFIDITL